MRYGTKMEPHAIATLVNVIIPSSFPELTYREEGMATHGHIASSGDGSLVHMMSPNEIGKLPFKL